VGFACSVSVENSINILESNFSLPPGRFSIFKGVKNITIIDSSYNSSLKPLIDALGLLGKIAESRRRVAILGDMRELGSMSEKMHTEVAVEIMKNSDVAILIGPNLAKFTVPILKKNDFKFKNFESFNKAKKSILELINNKDIVLVKGSQNTLFLERVVEMLLENPEDKEKLCRRGTFWNKKRTESL
jgi:UDP-N-acetylmuramoyl-tripeptide--D-alanyl-D-alanine ligase